MQEYMSRRAAEAKKMVEEIEMKVQHISAVEKEAAELLKVIPTLITASLYIHGQMHFT